MIQNALQLLHAAAEPASEPLKLTAAVMYRAFGKHIDAVTRHLTFPVHEGPYKTIYLSPCDNDVSEDLFSEIGFDVFGELKHARPGEEAVDLDYICIRLQSQRTGFSIGRRRSQRLAGGAGRRQNFQWSPLLDRGVDSAVGYLTQQLRTWCTSSGYIPALIEISKTAVAEAAAEPKALPDSVDQLSTMYTALCRQLGRKPRAVRIGSHTGTLTTRGSWIRINLPTARVRDLFVSQHYAPRPRGEHGSNNYVSGLIVDRQGLDQIGAKPQIIAATDVMDMLRQILAAAAPLVNQAPARGSNMFKELDRKVANALRAVRDDTAHVDFNDVADFFAGEDA